MPYICIILILCIAHIVYVVYVIYSDALIPIPTSDIRPILGMHVVVKIV